LDRVESIRGNVPRKRCILPHLTSWTESIRGTIRAALQARRCCFLDRVDGRDGRWATMLDRVEPSRTMVVEMSLALIKRRLIACESIHGESIHRQVQASEYGQVLSEYGQVLRVLQECCTFV